MHGLAGIISLQKQSLPEIEIKWKHRFDFQKNFTHRKIAEASFYIEQYTSDHFLKEKLFIDNEHFILTTEGVIHNLQKLCSENRCKDSVELISLLYKKKHEFFSEFSGSFLGIFFDKKNKKWILFNNHTGTKKVFYFIDKEYLVFASDLEVANQILSHLNRRSTLNIEAAYLLLTSGFMHENLTLVNEIKQLKAGEYGLLSDDFFRVQSYFNLSEITVNTDSKNIIIDTLEHKFNEAIRLEFDLDKAYNFKHITTLSGGLDSRMTALVAYKLGYINQTFFNFSEKGYADEIIAKRIANRYNADLFQISLNASSLTNIDQVTTVNDAQTVYTACSHAFSALKQINNQSYGLLHTGMIGDAVMGSFVSQVSPRKASIEEGLYSKFLVDKASDILKRSIDNYPTEELYKFYNRAFLGANNGFLYLDLLGESSSPFLNPSFLSYAYSIPRKYKYKESIYIDWIKTLHPDIASFTWESIGGKPTNNTYLRFMYKYKRAIQKRLPLKSMWKHNMNPEQKWYNDDMNVRHTLDTYFEDHISLFDSHKELRDDMIDLYQKGNITAKTQVLTLLSAYKLLFND